MSGEKFIDRVVENFADAVVQRPLVGAADIHSGLFAHGFKAFERTQVVGVVITGLEIRCGLRGFLIGWIFGDLFVWHQKE